MNTRSRKLRSRTFLIILDSGISSTRVTGKLKSKPKNKSSNMTAWEKNLESLRPPKFQTLNSD